MSRARVACVIPARNAAATVAATVAAAADLPGVGLVIVCADGSTDQTERAAGAAGAVVVTHARSRGRAAALESAVNALGVLEQRDRRPECGTLLLLDVDLGPAATALAPVVGLVRDDEADLAVAVPATRPTGLLTSTAARGIAELTEWTPTAPLATTRCLTRRAFELASPLAAGWGADVGMTIDVLRAGLRVREVETDVESPAEPRDLGGSLQRAAVLRDITRALAARGLVRAGIADFKEAGGVPGLIDRLRR